MLEFVDWSIILLYFVISIGIGVILQKRAGKNTGNFFLGGRKLPWYIAGTSMVATTFAADTPLAVTELVSENGIAGNWVWWNMMIGGMFTVFFFSRLWRRANIMTDCEFVTIRYSGAPAKFLRGFRAFYIGIFMNVIVIAWVNQAMETILSVLFPDFTIFGASSFSVLGFDFTSHLVLVAGLMLLTAIYASMSGLMGVSLIDSFQFFMAMAGCIVLAYYAVDSPQVGGLSGLKEKLPEWVMRFTPELSSNGSASGGGMMKMSLIAFATYLGVQWWASWYPGAEPGGGGYIAQRMMSAKDEKNSLFATLWFTIAHFAVRPWPWIITALCALVIYPDPAMHASGKSFVFIIRDFLPNGLLGLLIAAFLAAYMSTLASQTIWGTSYIVNDFYLPFINKKANQRKQIIVSRITAILLMIFSLFITAKLNTISGAWKFILECSAGMGLVLILRWYWWRINAWSEIVAILAPFIIYPFIPEKYAFPDSLLIIVGWSVFCWLVATAFTDPEPAEKLFSFYKRVEPGGIGWRPIQKKLKITETNTSFSYLFICWILGVVMVLSFLFGTGKVLLGQAQLGFGLIAVAIASGFVIWKLIGKYGFGK